MRISIGKTMLLSLMAASTVDVSAHPSREVLAKFSPHFRCPYANEWVSKGPNQAALDLGLLNATRASTSSEGSFRRRAQENVAGSCSYTNNWTNEASCLEFRGDAWTSENMGERCASETDSTLAVGAGCEVATGLGGYCVVGKGGGIEATPLPLTLGMDCEMARTTCENFMSGSFSQADGCIEGGPPPEAQVGGSPFAFEAPSEPVSCAIAPGAIGAGHQAGYSTGYSPNCEGTPAEGSPYMWPMAWKAYVESKSMAFGSDDVLYHSKGITHYRLDKNWKRQDWYYQRGIQRSVGQGPCSEEDAMPTDGPVLACRRDSDDYSTMIHRGGKMIFISWKNGTEVGTNDPNQIESCDWLDLAVVGNIRNDWYMDNRGDSTGVQYLGDQHVYHQGVPRLVKQWRKKDFANQYFVMSVLGNVKQDGIHWPMILNVPGEGFGDDFLQEYTNQTMLSDDDDYLFLLDEALEGIGGSCEKMGSGGGGPPTGQTVHIPSNLEVDPNSWFENVYTYSPVWEPPVEEEGQSMATGSTGIATTQEGDLTVKSCYDPTSNAVELSVEFANIDMIGSDLPWMALGYRETAECLMNPRDGGDTELILLSADASGEEVGAHFTLLPQMAKSMNENALTSIYSNMVPLEEKEGFSGVSLHLTSAAASMTKSAQDGAEDSVMLHFKQSMTETPEVMHLMYAIGNTPEVGYHKTRKCIDITEFPTCTSTESSSSDASMETSEAMVGSSAPKATLGLGAVFVSMAAALFL